MFSNQYIGTRSTVKTVPRIGSSFNFAQSGPYSRLDSEQPPRPVNARNQVDDDSGGVDYSFMNLPVRERRKLFLGGGSAPAVQHRHMHSMTMPRQRHPSDHTNLRGETQSEYGDDTTNWESTVTPTWLKDYRNASNTSTIKSQSSRTFNPTQNTSAAQSCPWYETSDRQVYCSSGRYSPRRNQEIYPITPHNNFRVFHDKGIRVYPVKHSTISSAKQTIQPTVNYQVYNMWKSPTPNRVSQPLKVNVYNSDHGTTIISPQPRINTAQIWNHASPIYPAYPARMERSTCFVESQPTRRRREHSVQPVTIHVTSKPYTETKQTWKAMQAPRWLDDQRSVTDKSYKLIQRPQVIQRRANVNDPEGVSDF